MTCSRCGGTGRITHWHPAPGSGGMFYCSMTYCTCPAGREHVRAMFRPADNLAAAVRYVAARYSQPWRAAPAEAWKRVINP